jgi:hypothetical protein
MIDQWKLLGVSVAVAGVLFCQPVQAAGAQVDEASSASARMPLPQRTMALVPNGVDAYTAFISDSALGAAGVGVIDGRPNDTKGTEASGGVRIWGSFLDRVVALGEAGKDSKGHFVPSLTVAIRALGAQEEGWSAGVLGRYRTEGFSTIDGEIEGGLLGSYAKNRLHLDANLIVGVGIEEKEADGEGLLRFGYDLAPMFRLGLETRIRRELADEGEAEAPGVEGGEWDAFAGAQGMLAFGHFFGLLTAGPQKPRFTEEVGWMAQMTLGGITF